MSTRANLAPDHLIRKGWEVFRLRPWLCIAMFVLYSITQPGGGGGGALDVMDALQATLALTLTLTLSLPLTLTLNLTRRGVCAAGSPKSWPYP